MKKIYRIVATVCTCAALTAGLSSILAGGHGHPAPPPPVLCGCACPGGGFVIVHAPTAEDCPAVCATACDQTS